MEGPPTKTGPYTTIDFRALAKKDSEFKKLWTQSSGHLNFQSPSTCLTLTKALLKTDFGLELDIPDDRLCPPVPNRWNYVVWLQELLASTSPDYMMSDERARGDSVEDEKEIVGLDIGAGASAIYTMLCLKSNPKWRMCLTDADKKSFDYAARNLALNKLLTRTTMLQTTQDMPLIPLKALGVETLDFTICNPPFFSDEAEMQASLKGEGKIAQPNSVCTGAASEMVCPGGDLGFVTRIVEESLVLRERVRWYSSMLGKLSSVKAVIELLKKEGVKNWAVGYLDPGGSGGTKRWLVAWSFGDLRPRNVSLKKEWGQVCNMC
jgi:23S rRNA (adenine1618-N6)-methyltransferase